jgi:acyl-coenzyme A thioesterase PaaI-like protein
MSTDLNTQFFKGVQIATHCLGEARIDRLGRSIAFTSAVVMNEKGEICAKAVDTAILTDAPKL